MDVARPQPQCEAVREPPSESGGADAATRGRVGVGYGVAAYLWWGLCPFYFKAVADVPPVEILAHRVIWSALLLVALLRTSGRWHVAIEAVKDRSTLLVLIGTTFLIAVNWFTFIWAVTHGAVLQSSLGYFLGPLCSILLGFVFLRERLHGLQTVSVALATVGVAYLAFGYGGVSWVAIVLPVSFGLYGLLRKTVKADSLTGLTIETVLLTPVALAFLIYQATRGECVFGFQSRGTDLLLALAGVVTALPLLWFTNAARRLRLATLGFLQYITPSMHFLLAVAAFGEEFTTDHLIAFALIWTALALYSSDTARRARGRSPAG